MTCRSATAGMVVDRGLKGTREKLRAQLTPVIVEIRISLLWNWTVM